MARPKLGDSETERLHMKITKDELEAIEDWRYANRVPSKSEAVRRLCAAALVALNGLEKLRRIAEDISVSALDDHEHVGGDFRRLIDDAVKGNEHGFDYLEAKNLLHDHADRAYWQEQNARIFNRIIIGLSDATAMLAEPQNFAAAEKNAKERLSELDAYVDLQHEGWALMEASHARSAVLRSMTQEERNELDQMESREDRIAYIDQKVSKYQASRRRREKRLRDKVRREDELVRQAFLKRFRSEDGQPEDDAVLEDDNT